MSIPDPNPGNASVHITVVGPDALVESAGVPYLITETPGVKFEVIRPDSAAMLLLTPTEAITLGKELYRAGREAARNTRKDTRP